MKTRENRKVKRAHRSAAFHSDRARRAVTALQRYRAAGDELVSAAKRTRNARVARDLRKQVASHVHTALEKSGASDNSKALYRQKLSESGTEVQRLGIALMCLQGAIGHLPATERDRFFDHYTQSFSAEAGRIKERGGVR